MNQRQAERLARLVTALLPHQGTAAVLGLSYKPDTDVIEEAQGILLIEQLLAQSISVVAHDPVAGDHARRRIPPRASPASPPVCEKPM